MRGDHGRDGVYRSSAWAERGDARGLMCGGRRGGGGGKEVRERVISSWFLGRLSYDISRRLRWLGRCGGRKAGLSCAPCDWGCNSMI